MTDIAVEFEYDSGDWSVGIRDGWVLTAVISGSVVNGYIAINPEFGKPVGAWRVCDSDLHFSRELFQAAPAVLLDEGTRLHDLSPRLRWAVAEEWAKLIEFERLEALAENQMAAEFVEQYDRDRMLEFKMDAEMDHE